MTAPVGSRGRLVDGEAGDQDLAGAELEVDDDAEQSCQRTVFSVAGTGSMP